jgi:RNA polymerase sigma-70 factor (ECF subfamily)
MRVRALADEMFVEFEPGSGLSAGDALPPENRALPPSGELPVARLYRTERPRLLRFFARRVGRAEAHDLVQEAFASLLAAVSRRPKSIEQPEAYLTRVATNLVLKRGRTAARRSTALHIPADEAALTGTDTEAHLEERDMLERLETAMLRLRPLTREIFMAHRLDGYTYREIAERTGLSVKRVEKHMSRAIARLDDILGMDTRCP